MTRVLATLITMVSAATALLLTMAWRPTPQLVWNASGSVPIGLYRLQTTRRTMINDLVVVMPPEPLATFLANGGYLPRGVPLIKRVLAVAGQTVCRQGFSISVDGLEIGAARERDFSGRLLPDWQGCRILEERDIFLMNPHPGSVDGRYFGVLPCSSIVGRVAMLWTVEALLN